MGTGRWYTRSKGRARPVKGEGDRRRRQNTHRKRLVALGLDEAVVRKMDGKTLRATLKNPPKVSVDA